VNTETGRRRSYPASKNADKLGITQISADYPYRNFAIASAVALAESNGHNNFDCVVRGARGIAHAAAKIGAKTALITIDKNKIGAMSCNPAIGGLAKGQIVREVDALGGLMGLATDATGIQFRMLNRSKGPAVQSPRAQADKYRYQQYMINALEQTPNLTIVEQMAVEIIARHLSSG
jgi:tRNA uridine 5-carboxymethylaminomethyl modification enzyme